MAPQVKPAHSHSGTGQVESYSGFVQRVEYEIAVTNSQVRGKVKPLLSEGEQWKIMQWEDGSRWHFYVDDFSTGSVVLSGPVMSFQSKEELIAYLLGE